MFITDSFGTEIHDPFLKIKNADSPLKITTYDGSGQLTHPDVLFSGKGWNHYRYWMVFTPYPDGNNKFENPSLRCSSDGIHWIIPSALMPDPVVPPPADVNLGGFNSDPDMVLVDDNLYLFYRHTDASRKTTVYLKTSYNICCWTLDQPTDLPSTTASPAFVYDGFRFHCWYVEYTGAGHEPYGIFYCNSEDGLHWSEAVPVMLEVKDFTPWHLNITCVNNRYDMLLTAYRLGSNNAHTVLFHAVSADGIHWSLPSSKPMLQPGENSWDSREIYRAAMVKDSEGYKIWYSAASLSGKWGIGLLIIRQ